MDATREMNATELKPLLKAQASESGIELSRFTIWVENGTHFSYEDHAQDDYQTSPIIARCMLRDKSRIALLDLLEDRLYVWSLEVG